jgi:hypothetical protein
MDSNSMRSKRSSERDDQTQRGDCATGVFFKKSHLKILLIERIVFAQTHASEHLEIDADHLFVGVLQRAQQLGKQFRHVGQYLYW